LPLVLALVSARFYGTADFLGGLAARRAPAIAATAFAQGAGLVFLAAAMPFFSSGMPTSADVSWGIGAGLTGGVGVAHLYYGLAAYRVSVVAPVTAVCSIAVPVLVALALGERPRPLAVGGIAIAVLSVGLISRQQDPGGAPRGRDRSILIALASGVAIGGFLVCLARAGTTSGLWPLLVARAVSTAALALAARGRLAVPRSVLPLVIGCGAIDVLANALYVVAVGAGPLGLVATLASLYQASTVLLARLVLRERLRPVQSFGLACAAAAIVLITTR